MINKTEAAYIASLIDGEGCFYTKKGYLRYRLTITNTNIQCLQRIKTIIGTGYIDRTKNYSPENHNDCYRLHFTARQTILFLQEIYPYLIIKKAKAKEAILLINTRSGRKINGIVIQEIKFFDNIKLSDEEKYAYLAGLIDGEGCITIGAKYKDSRVNIANTNLECLLTMQQWFQLGNIVMGKKRPSNCKKIFALNYGATAMRFLLPKIIPFMIIKKEKAEMALKYLEENKRTVGNKKRPGRLEYFRNRYKDPIIRAKIQQQTRESKLRRKARQKLIATQRSK